MFGLLTQRSQCLAKLVFEFVDRWWRCQRNNVVDFAWRDELSDLANEIIGRFGVRKNPVIQNISQRVIAWASVWHWLFVIRDFENFIADV